MTAEFLPKGYRPPTTSNYFKFKKGENRFRVLSAATVGFEYWNRDNKPVRVHEMPKTTPDDIGYTMDKKTNENKQNPIRHFWAFLVWSYSEERVQLLEITQSTVMQGLQSFVTNPKWGNPTGYDIVVKREGDGLAAKYLVTAEPHTPIDPKIKAEWDVRKTGINLAAFFEGKDPFGTPVAAQSTGKVEVYEEDEINPLDIPF